MEAVYSFKILNKCFFDKKQQKKLDKKLFLNILIINIILDFILIIVFNWFSFFKKSQSNQMVNLCSSVPIL